MASRHARRNAIRKAAALVRDGKLIVGPSRSVTRRRSPRPLRADFGMPSAEGYGGIPDDLASLYLEVER
jgi:hypothetical protein